MAAQAATVELRETERGKILVDEAGFTLYMFTSDKKHQDHCVNIEMNGAEMLVLLAPAASHGHAHGRGRHEVQVRLARPRCPAAKNR